MFFFMKYKRIACLTPITLSLAQNAHKPFQKKKDT
jgi:hypothetical protein